MSDGVSDVGNQVSDHERCSAPETASGLAWSRRTVSGKVRIVYPHCDVAQNNVTSRLTGNIAENCVTVRYCTQEKTTTHEKEPWKGCSDPKNSISIIITKRFYAASISLFSAGALHTPRRLQSPPIPRYGPKRALKAVRVTVDCCTT